MPAGARACACLAWLGLAAAQPQTTGITVEQDAVQGTIEPIAMSGIEGYTTYRLSLVLKSTSRNVYTIYGRGDSPLSFPPAAQVAPPFGANLCGANPAFFTAEPTAQYDSWLTVGQTNGEDTTAINSIGLDFVGWTEAAPLQTTNGAVFWMSPENAPTALVRPLPTRCCFRPVCTLPD